MNDLVNIISASGTKQQRHNIFTPRSKWFNYRCNVARSESFYWLHEYHRTQSREHKTNYLNANKNYKMICEESENNYNKQLKQKINMVNDSREWWRFVKEVKNQPFSNDNVITAESFKEYFQKITESRTNC